MIKPYHYLLLITLIAACQNDDKKATGLTPIVIDTAVRTVEVVQDEDPQVTNDTLQQPAFLLKESRFQLALLKEIDQWYIRRGDTLRNYKTDGQVIALNALYLKDFVARADLSQVYTEAGVHVSYNFNSAPKPYTDTESCEDHISLRFVPENNEYIFQLTNNYFVDAIENPDCYGSDNIIRFKIADRKITVTDILHAG